MTIDRLPHDPAYKAFFSNPEMVESLLRDFVPAEFVAELDFSTLERCSGSYVTDDLRERHDDIVWRVRWKHGSWCYAPLLIFEFQSSQDYWMGLRVLSYTALLLLDLVKSGAVREEEGLPPVFPMVIYNGGKPWNAPRELASLFAPMPDSLRVYQPGHRYFLLDEGRIGENALEKSTGLTGLLVRLERARTPEDVRRLVRELVARLHGPQYLSLRRTFTVWLGRVVFKRAGITQHIPEFHSLQEVEAMLEERAAQWKDEYIQQGVIIGEARGISIGKAEGISIGKAEGISIGEARGIRKTLISLLEGRFGSLPPAVALKLADMTDTDRLSYLVMCVYKVNSLEEFSSLLEKRQ